MTLDKAIYKDGEQAVYRHSPTICRSGACNDRFRQGSSYTPYERSCGRGEVLRACRGRVGAPGAYAMVTHYRPLSDRASRAPVRSIGLAYLEIDQGERTLDVAVDLPEVARPQGEVKLPISVAGAKGATFVTIAAVDEGILQLTDFSSPDPLKHYFGKRRLGLDIRDDYGRLISPEEGAVGKLRSGGDGAPGGEGLTVVPTKSVALFSGIVNLDSSGKAEVTFDLPDFVGELRVMAVAWNKSQIGRVDGPLTVRQPVVADLTLPRFLAPEDQAQATLLLDNVEGPEGTYSAVLKTGGSVAGEARAVDVDLQEKERKVVSLPIAGSENRHRYSNLGSARTGRH